MCVRPSQEWKRDVHRCLSLDSMREAPRGDRDLQRLLLQQLVEASLDRLLKKARYGCRIVAEIERAVEECLIRCRGLRGRRQRKRVLAAEGLERLLVVLLAFPEQQVNGPADLVDLFLPFDFFAQEVRELALQQR